MQLCRWLTAADSTASEAMGCDGEYLEAAQKACCMVPCPAWDSPWTWSSRGGLSSTLLSSMALWLSSASSSFHVRNMRKKSPGREGEKEGGGGAGKGRGIPGYDQGSTAPTNPQGAEPSTPAVQTVAGACPLHFTGVAST